MVTTVAGNQGQITLKGVQITDEWEARVRTAATRNGQGFTAFVAETTDAAALAILKGEPAMPAALPVRIEDIAAALDERLARIERQGRRGRWRR